jgi:hypothetical protein
VENSAYFGARKRYEGGIGSAALLNMPRRIIAFKVTSVRTPRTS